ncbi:MAG: hypothetical protein ACETWK_14300 [Candidatus Aminicenantaceae bacterium]
MFKKRKFIGKRIMLVGSLLGLAMLGLFCTKVQEVSLRGMVWSWSPENDEAFERALSKIGESRGVDIELTLIADQDTYFDSLADKLQKGESPDVFWVRYDMVSSLAEEGRIVEVSHFIKEHPEVIRGLTEEELGRFQYKGGLYGIPFAAPGGSPRNAYVIASISKHIDLAFSIIKDIKNIKLLPAWRNPDPNSVIVAHGDAGDAMDFAEAFISGKDSKGQPVAGVSNHCPDTWTKRHIHVKSLNYPLVSLTNTDHFYHDLDLISTGKDHNLPNGIDQAMLFFCVGHSSFSQWSPPNCDLGLKWQTVGNYATAKHMSLGDYDGWGFLRYYWQASCWVFAHGPLNCPSASEKYSCPWMYNGSPDKCAMRSVYDRWGPVLNPDLRMACGVSTSCSYGPYKGSEIWNYLNNLQYNITDAWIWGMVADPKDAWMKPLCITLGGKDIKKTPLYDKKFDNKPNTSGTSYYHIIYAKELKKTGLAVGTGSKTTPLSAPVELPILKIKPMQLPPPLRDIRFKPEENFLVSPDEVEERGPRVRINRLSGAVYVVGEQMLDEMPILEDEEYVEHALHFIEEAGWSEEVSQEASGVRLIIARRPVEGDGEDIDEFQKNVIVTFRRQIEVDSVWVNVIGEGGEINVQMNNDGSVLNASKVWREIEEVSQPVPVKTYEQALQEALEQLDNPDVYQLYDWTWGYREDAGNIEQNELRVVYRFWFRPVLFEGGERTLGRMIEIPAQV